MAQVVCLVELGGLPHKEDQYSALNAVPIQKRRRKSREVATGTGEEPEGRKGEGLTSGLDRVLMNQMFECSTPSELPANCA